MSYSRIMIIGSGGAGKSTLSRQIHKITGLPLYHLDQYYWKPEWKESEKTEWEKTVTKLSKQPEWILDGNYGGTMDIRLERADLVIFLNPSRWICLWRVIKRTLIYYGRSRPDMPENCHERLSWEFLVYIWNYKKTRSPGILNRISKLSPNQKGIVFEKRSEVKDFLESLKGKS